MIAILSLNIEKLKEVDWKIISDVILVNHGQDNYGNIKNQVRELVRHNLFKDLKIVVIYPLPKGRDYICSLLDSIGYAFEDEVLNCER